MRQFLADASHELRTPPPRSPPTQELFDRGPPSIPRTSLASSTVSARSRRGWSADRRPSPAREPRRGPTPRARRSSSSRSRHGPLTRAGRWVPIGRCGFCGPTRRDPRRRSTDPPGVRQPASNVRSHTPRGTLTDLVISADGDSAEIRVADQGPGLDDDATRHVFDRFYRADGSRLAPGAPASDSPSSGRSFWRTTGP